MVEYVIAYGCRKDKWPGYPSEPLFLPEAPWPRSMEGLRRLILAPVRDANIWLQNNIHGYPGYGYPDNRWNPPRPDGDLRGDAHYLAERFCGPVHTINAKSIQIKADTDVAEITLGSFKTLAPLKGGSKYVLIVHGNPIHMTWQEPNSDGPRRIDDGSRLVVKAGYSETTIMVNGTIVAKLRPYFQATLSGLWDIEVLECTCGHCECADRHRLDSWDPGIPGIDLVSFIASAVKGPGLAGTHHKIVTGAFKEGMYFALLAEGFCQSMRLRCEEVEYKVCLNCKFDYEEPDKCPKCGVPFD